MSRYVPPLDFGSDDSAGLRGRLTGMRAELVKQVARDRIEAVALTLLTGVNAAIVACEPAAAPADVVEGARAILAVSARRPLRTIRRHRSTSSDSMAIRNSSAAKNRSAPCGGSTSILRRRAVVSSRRATLRRPMSRISASIVARAATIFSAEASGREVPIACLFDGPIGSLARPTRGRPRKWRIFGEFARLAIPNDLYKAAFPKIGRGSEARYKFRLSPPSLPCFPRTERSPLFEGRPSGARF